MLKIYPDDCKAEDGSLYWSGPRRKPVPIELDLQNESHISFITATSNLYAYIFNLPTNINRKQIQKPAVELVLSENQSSNLETEKEIDYLTEQLKSTRLFLLDSNYSKKLKDRRALSLIL